MNSHWPLSFFFKLYSFSNLTLTNPHYPSLTLINSRHSTLVLIIVHKLPSISDFLSVFIKYRYITIFYLWLIYSLTYLSLFKHLILNKYITNIKPEDINRLSRSMWSVCVTMILPACRPRNVKNADVSAPKIPSGSCGTVLKYNFWNMKYN